MNGLKIVDSRQIVVIFGACLVKEATSNGFLSGTCDYMCSG